MLLLKPSNLQITMLILKASCSCNHPGLKSHNPWKKESFAKQLHDQLHWSGAAAAHWAVRYMKLALRLLSPVWWQSDRSSRARPQAWESLLSMNPCGHKPYSYNPHAFQPSCFFNPDAHFSKNQQRQGGYNRCSQPSCCHLPKETKRADSIEAENFSLHKINDLLLLSI